MKLGKLAATMTAAIGLSMAGGMAHAAVYYLTVDGCTGGCLARGQSSIGSVTVTENKGALDFTVALTGGARFNVNDGPQHHAFVFDLVGGGAPLSGLKIDSFTTMNNLGHSVSTTDFAASSARSPYSEAPFGSSWPYAIDYVGRARQGHDESNFSFVVSDTSNNLTLSMLSSIRDKADQYIEFAADVYNPVNCKTGNVGALYHSVSAVPEPAAWGLMFSGLFGVGAVLRRKRNAAPATA